MVVISLGGSLIVPEEIDWQFIKEFKEMIEAQIAEGYRFVIVTGGGKIARKYIEAGTKIEGVDAEDKDWLGIHATRMNAHFIRTIFKKYAHPTINKNPHDLEPFLRAKEAVLVAAGYRPGNSTDFIAVKLAQELGVHKVANLSDIDFVCDKDPRTNPDAQKIENISWSEFQKIVGEAWDPGANVPFDPVASKLAAKAGIEVAIFNGRNLKNLEKYITGKRFEGTVVR